MKDVIELYSFIKSIPMQDNEGKEIVLLVNSTLSNNKTFYTDSNGLELQKRILNYRPTWNLTVSDTFCGNGNIFHLEKQGDLFLQITFSRYMNLRVETTIQ